MKRRVFLDVYDDTMTIGNALKLLNDIGYDNLWGYGQEFVLWTSDDHRIFVKHLKTGVKIEISNEVAK